MHKPKTSEIEEQHAPNPAKNNGNNRDAHPSARNNLTRHQGSYHTRHRDSRQQPTILQTQVNHLKCTSRTECNRVDQLLHGTYVKVVGRSPTAVLQPSQAKESGHPPMVNVRNIDNVARTLTHVRISKQRSTRQRFYQVSSIRTRHPSEQNSSVVHSEGEH
jgi:hypothetical protein